MFCIFLLFSTKVKSQQYQLGIFGGIANYQGDLKPNFFSFEQARPAFQLIAKWNLNERFGIRAGYAKSTIYADDKFNRPDLQQRNLNFHTSLDEVSIALEINLANPDKYKLTPFVFGGVGVFYYNPYTYYNQQKIFLKPLTTEGQNLKQYPDRKSYSLTQLCLPYGIGIKYKINCLLTISAEFSQRKLFTDYFDDVSKTYADPSVIAAAKGPLAAKLSWRGDEIPGGSPVPTAGLTRGNPKENDWYYFLGATLYINLLNCETNKFIFQPLLSRKRKNHQKASYYRCPRYF